MNEVTELDLRLPEFRDPKLKLEDLEFDGSGQVVRKDRFEKAMSKMSGMLRGINGLNARSAWTCEQVVKAVSEVLELRQLINIVNNAPDDAEFYDFENDWYVKSIDQEMLMEAKKDPSADILVNYESRGFSEEWCENSAWLDLIDALVSVDDLKLKIKKISDVESCQ